MLTEDFLPPKSTLKYREREGGKEGVGREREWREMKVQVEGVKF